MSGQPPESERADSGDEPTTPDAAESPEAGETSSTPETADAVGTPAEEPASETLPADESADESSVETGGDATAAATTSATPPVSAAMASRREDRPDLGGRRRDFEQEFEAPRRRRFLVGVIAAVVVIALAVGLTVYLLNRSPAASDDPPPPTSSPTSSAQAVLPAASMLTADQAKLIQSGVTWKVVSDQDGAATSTSPACLSPGAVQGGPNAQALRSRTLTGSGSGSPMALHQAQAFGSADEATVTYALFARALGNCDLANSYVLSGSVIKGLGDQGTAVVIDDQVKKQYRTVVIDRTGLVVNVLDVVTSQDGNGDTTGVVAGAVQALGKVTDVQCTAAIGQCASLVSVTSGPPPVAGDQPGFLAAADIPQPQSGTGTWGGQNPAKPGSLITSGCEDVDFSKVDADSSGARTYLLTDKPTGMPDAFGLDEAVFTLADEKSATELAKQLTDNIENCKERQLTATVDGPQAITGVGADGAAISGDTYGIAQKVSDTSTSNFRVGVATVGNKLVYTFLPVQDTWNLTDDQWQALTVRAGQRASQST